MAKPKKKFPQQVYVTREVHSDETFFAVVNNVDDIDMEQEVAVYQLVDVRKLKITRSFE